MGGMVRGLHGIFQHGVFHVKEIRQTSDSLTRSLTTQPARWKISASTILSEECIGGAVAYVGGRILNMRIRGETRMLVEKVA